MKLHHAISLLYTLSVAMITPASAGLRGNIGGEEDEEVVGGDTQLEDEIEELASKVSNLEDGNADLRSELDNVEEALQGNDTGNLFDNTNEGLFEFNSNSDNGNSNGGNDGNASGRGNGGNGNGRDKHAPDTYQVPEEAVGEMDHIPPLAQNVDPFADIRATAQAMSMSLDDAQELLKQQHDFAELVDLLQDDNNFLQADMPDKPNGEFIIVYKNGNMPPGRHDDIDKFKAKNQNVKVANKASKLSRKDAEGRGERLANKLERKGYSNISFSIDADGLDVVAKKSSTHDKDRDNGIISLHRAAEILELPADAADLQEFSLALTEYDDEDPVTPFHTYGGRKISGNGSQCTTAFSVISTIGSGTTGIATAAHCEGMNRYDAVSPESDYSTFFQREHKGWYGDMEWHVTAHIEPAEYYATPSTRWPVRSVASSISRGQVVCGYSRMQGTRWCDRVYSTNVSVQYRGLPRMYNLVAMETSKMVPGDSGGPWSYYDRAYGIASGYMTINGSRRDIWSRVSFLRSAINVQVRTQ